MEKTMPSYRKTVVGFSALSLSLGLFSFVFELALPFAIGMLAVLFLLENPRKRLASYLVSVALISVEIFLCVVGIPYGAYAPAMLIPALFLAFAFRREWIRRDASVVLILLIFALMLVSAYFTGAHEAGSFVFADVADWYTKAIANLKSEMIASFQKVFDDYAALGSLPEESVKVLKNGELAKSLADTFFEQVIAYVVCGAMIFAAIAIGLFSKTVRKITKIQKNPFFSDFITTSLTAYLFFLVSAIDAFSGASHTPFAIGVRNLVFILVLPYAYIGLKGLFGILKRSRSRMLRWLVVLGLILFNVYAIRLVAYFGAFSNIMFNRAFNAMVDGGDHMPKE